jgi:hypothetical protein
MGESITTGMLASWEVKSGSVVAADEVVGAIETDKVYMYTYMYIYMYVCICIYTYVHIVHIYIHIPTIMWISGGCG